MKHFLIFGIVLIAAFSCKKQDTTIVYGYHYFPFEEGKYVVYDVLDIFHDVALDPAHDTNRYQIKEVISDAFVDEEGETSRRLLRYIRENDSADWAIKDVWAIKRTPRNAQVVEENDRYIKMAFAISYDQDWDCNALNNESSKDCYYADIYRPYSIGGMTHDSTVTVEHEDFQSFIDYKRSFEVYAAGIGKVHSVKKDLSINNNDTLDVQYGTELIYTAVEWGEE
ncbi:MAG: hypothetical protein MI810_16195 [Flavobacteriales bacterium]|nr:hypothetical protein [Flavobacteriales bacterium]